MQNGVSTGLTFNRLKREQKNRKKKYKEVKKKKPWVSSYVKKKIINSLIVLKAYCWFDTINVPFFSFSFLVVV